jgi:CRISP-associated protein Cas1
MISEPSASNLTVLPDLVPARMLNEFAYCPRLAYLEWVDGEFTDNLDTVEGRFAHRRADRESSKSFEATEDDSPTEKIHARSAMLSSASDGIIAKLDIVESEGNVATPVDYKRGRVPDIPGNAWEPERVQLCAQGLVLRANGFESYRGYLYYVESRKRIEVVFDDELVARTRELLSLMRVQLTLRQAPPPLVDSPKCPRCSLVGICLPDETNLLSVQGDELLQRRIIADHRQALPFYVQGQGCRVGKSSDRIVVKEKDAVVSDARILDVSQLCLFGNVQISTQAVHELIDRGIPICYFSYGGYFLGMTTGLVHKNIELRRRQFEVASQSASSLALAREFIVGKIKNCRTLIRRAAEDGNKTTLDRLAEFQGDASRAACVETLLGIEGMAAKWYFESLSQRLKGHQVFRLDGRNRRPPTDPVNAILSFLYALLVKELTVTASAVGFDPMLGFLHQPRYGRPALALDLCEEFRPLVADSTALTLINTGEIKPDDFVKRGEAVALTASGRKTVLSAYERRMESLITHPIFGYQISYRRTLEVQARLLSRVLRGEIAQYPAFVTR